MNTCAGDQEHDSRVGPLLGSIKAGNAPLLWKPSTFWELQDSQVGKRLLLREERVWRICIIRHWRAALGGKERVRFLVGLLWRQWSLGLLSTYFWIASKNPSSPSTVGKTKRIVTAKHKQHSENSGTSNVSAIPEASLDTGTLLCSQLVVHAFRPQWSVHNILSKGLRQNLNIHYPKSSPFQQSADPWPRDIAMFPSAQWPYDPPNLQSKRAQGPSRINFFFWKLTCRHILVKGQTCNIMSKDKTKQKMNLNKN